MKRYRLAAFTLIEVVIVVSIIGIISALTLVSFSRDRAIRGLDRASHEVSAALREAQNYSLSGRSASTSEENCWYGIQISSANAYTLINRFGPSCNSSGTIASYNLKDGVTFTGFSLPATLAFALPRAETMYWNGSAMVSMSTPFLLGLTKGGVVNYICMYPTGRIVERGVNNTCP